VPAARAASAAVVAAVAADVWRVDTCVAAPRLELMTFCRCIHHRRRQPPLTQLIRPLSTEEYDWEKPMKSCRRRRYHRPRATTPPQPPPQRPIPARHGLATARLGRRQPVPAAATRQPRQNPLPPKGAALPVVVPAGTIAAEEPRIAPAAASTSRTRAVRVGRGHRRDTPGHAAEGEAFLLLNLLSLLGLAPRGCPASKSHEGRASPPPTRVSARRAKAAAATNAIAKRTR